MYSLYKQLCPCRVGAVASMQASSGVDCPITSVDRENMEATVKDSKSLDSHFNVENASEATEKNETAIECVVNNSWLKIEKQRVEEMTERQKMSPKNKHPTKGWKTVRVFVSSTFTDMHSEREILIKKVISNSF